VAGGILKGTKAGKNFVRDWGLCETYDDLGGGKWVKRFLAILHALRGREEGGKDGGKQLCLIDDTVDRAERVGGQTDDSKISEKRGYVFFKMIVIKWT